MSRSKVKYPLTDLAKHEAKTLVEKWKNGTISQYFEIHDTTAGAASNRTFGYGLGINDETNFTVPSIGVILELSQFQLLVVSGQITHTLGILLLQELQNAVENDFQVSDYFLTFNAVGTIILGNPTISAPFQSGASIYGNVSQEISSPELAEQLTEILGNTLIESNTELASSIQELTNSIESERQSKLGKVVSELGRVLQHGANAYVIAQAIGFIGQVLR